MKISKKILIGLVIGFSAFLGMMTNVSKADTAAIDFELFALGNVNGQFGWSKTGPYDVEVETNTYGYGTFESQTLRISNAVTSSSFGDQTFSKSLVDEAGETTAGNGGMSGGTRENYFEASWDFASTVPIAEQPGLSVVASPDRGDGARMSWVQMTDTPSGLEVNFYDVQGVEVGDTAPCLQCANFVQTNVVSGLDRSVPHNIKITMQFVDGESNDVVKVYVDGVLEHTGKSWEDYYTMDTESSPVPPRVSRTVDSILFRVGGAAAPATLGNGFLIDNLNLKSITPDMPSVPTITSPIDGASVAQSAMLEVDWSDSTGTFSPFEYQYEVFSDAGYSSSIYQSGWLTLSEIPTPGTPLGDYFVRVRARDAEGNMSAWSNGSSDVHKISVVADPTPTPTPINPFEVPAQCNQNIVYNLINGTSGSDNIKGTSGSDMIYALNGSDKVDGKGGSDCIVGGTGSDSLTGGNGDDVILGGDGSDSLKGDGGNDDLYGENGSDSIKGGSGNDDLFGGDNSDSLKGDGGTDTSDGGNGSDACNAETESACEA